MGILRDKGSPEGNPLNQRITRMQILLRGALVSLTCLLLTTAVSGCTKKVTEPKTTTSNEAASANPATAPAPKKAAPVVPTDPAAAAALRQVEAKLQALQSYSCTIKSLGHMELRDGPHDSEALIEEAYKRPCRFKIRVTNIKDPLVGFEGTVSDIVVDGQTWLERRQHVLGSGQRRLDSLKGKPVMSAEEFIRLHDTPVTTTKDLKAWLQSGFTEDDLLEQVQSRILKPFRACDMATLKIESEDDTQWTFYARLQQTEGSVYHFVRVTIGKADGIRKESHLGRDDDSWQGTARVERIELNPDLPDTFFQDTPPLGAEKQ